MASAPTPPADEKKPPADAGADRSKEDAEKKLNELKKELETKLQQTKTEFEAKLNELKASTDVKGKVDEAKKALEAEIKAKQTEFQTKLKEAKEKFDSEGQAKLSELKTSIQTEIQAKVSELQKKLETEVSVKVNEVKTSLQTEVQSKVSEAKTKLTQVKEDLQKELKARGETGKSEESGKTEAPTKVEGGKEIFRKLTQQKLELEGLRKEHENWRFYIVAGVVLLAIASQLFGGKSLSDTDVVLTSDLQVQVRFLAGLHQIRDQFPMQSNRLWRKLRMATLPFLAEDDPDEPSTVLLVGSNETRQLSTCLADLYAELVTTTFNTAPHGTFDCASKAVEGSSAQQVQQELNDFLATAAKEGSKSCVVLHVEHLRGSTAEVFDNQTASAFANGTIVLTLTLDSKDASTENEHSVFKKLREVWGKILAGEKLDPLLVRIANSIVFVRKESQEVLKQAGCLA